MKLLFKTIPQIADELSSTLYGRVRLTVSLWFFVLLKKSNFKKYDFSISCSFKSKSFFLHLRHITDLAVLREVFVEKEYDWQVEHPPSVVFDLGAHFGDTALFYHAVYPDALIIAVEPSPENFSRLKNHVSEIKKIVPINAAVGAEDGTLSLHLSKSSFGHSSVPRNDDGKTVEVNMITLQSLMKRLNINQIDLLKFDIEGAEFDVLRSIGEITQVKSLIGELHFDLAEGVTTNDLKDILNNYDYNIEQIPNFYGRYILKGVKI